MTRSVVSVRVQAAYAIGVGLAILGFWLWFALSGQIPELDTAPLEIGYHLVAETATALALPADGLVADRPPVRR